MTYIIILKMLENRYIIFDGDCGFCNNVNRQQKVD